MTTDKTTFSDLFYALREGQIAMAHSLITLSKFFVFSAATQLILIAYMFWKLADSTSDLLLLAAMFAATVLPLSWGLVVLPDRLRGMLADGLKRPAEHQG